MVEVFGLGTKHLAQARPERRHPGQTMRTSPIDRWTNVKILSSSGGFVHWPCPSSWRRLERAFNGDRRRPSPGTQKRFGSAIEERIRISGAMPQLGGASNQYEASLTTISFATASGKSSGASFSTTALAASPTRAAAAVSIAVSPSLSASLISTLLMVTAIASPVRV